MGFADITRNYLTPAALALDPAEARQQYLQAINQAHRLGTGNRAQALVDDRRTFDLDLRDRTIQANRGFKSLLPKERRYRPPGNPDQYMIDAILRDNAIAEYDREAPRLREQARAGGPA